MSLVLMHHILHSFNPLFALFCLFLEAVILHFYAQPTLKTNDTNDVDFFSLGRTQML